MKMLKLAAATAIGLAAAACGRSDGDETAQADAAPETSAAAAAAAMDASSVTSIPGYTPGATDSAPAGDGAAGTNAQP